MNVHLVRAPRLTQEVPYAYAAIAPPGSLIFTAGACPIDENDRVVGVGDVEHQAEVVMANLVQALASAGATLTDVLKTTVYVASAKHEDLMAAWNVIRESFGDHDAPSTLVGVAALGYTNQLVEVEAIATAPAPPPPAPSPSA